MRVILPLGAPALAAVAILQFQGAWNNFFWPLILYQEQSHWTLPLGLAQFRSFFEGNWPALTAVVVMATLPILVLYLYFQRYFVAGIAASASRAEADARRGPGLGRPFDSLGRPVLPVDPARACESGVGRGPWSSSWCLRRRERGYYALLASPLLTLALVGVGRLAGHIVRGEEVVFSDALRGPLASGLGRRSSWVSSAWAVTAILGTNIVVGLATGTPMGFALAALAAWGLVGPVAERAFPFWILLADPVRTAWSAADVIRLAALLLLARPLLLVGLGAASALVLVVSADPGSGAPHLRGRLCCLDHRPRRPAGRGSVIRAVIELPRAARCTACRGAVGSRLTPGDRHPMTFPVQIGPSTITINRDDRVLVCQPDGRVLGEDDGFFTRDTRFISGYDDPDQRASARCS